MAFACITTDSNVIFYDELRLAANDTRHDYWGENAADHSVDVHVQLICDESRVSCILDLRGHGVPEADIDKISEMFLANAKKYEAVRTNIPPELGYRQLHHWVYVLQAGDKKYAHGAFIITTSKNVLVSARIDCAENYTTTFYKSVISRKTYTLHAINLNLDRVIEYIGGRIAKTYNKKIRITYHYNDNSICAIINSKNIDLSIKKALAYDGRILNKIINQPGEFQRANVPNNPQEPAQN